MPIAQEMKNLTEDIQVSYGERMGWLGDLQKDTHQMMNRIRKDHKAMAKELDTFLDSSESTRMSNFKEVLSAIQTRQRDREEEVASLIEKFEDELDEMANELKAFLGKSEQRRLEEFKQMLTEIKNKQRAREKEVVELLGAFQKDMSDARTHWQNLARIMASKCAGRKVPVTKVPKEAKVPKRVGEAAEEAFGAGELKARALNLIEESPGGISLKQLSSKLEVHYIRLARPIKELLEEWKVIKRDSLYFQGGET